ncbi:MAG: hypothetical protein AAF624_08000 [Bacteroidota bacterium]
MNITLERLYQLHRGELPETEAAALRTRLAGDADLRAEYARITSISTALEASVAPSFGPYFSDRVLRRIHDADAPMQAASPVMLPYEALRWVFVRVAFGVLLAVVGFSVVAGVQAKPGESFVASVFGLPSATERDETALPLLDATVLMPFVNVEASAARP